MHEFRNSALVPRVGTSTGIAHQDPLRKLPHNTMVSLATAFGIASTDRLLELPDRVILGQVRETAGCGPKELAAVATWLYQQRQQRNELVSAPLEARAVANQALDDFKHQLTRAVRAAIRSQRLDSSEVARRCASSREAVESLVQGGTPGSLELAMRMAVALGVRFELKVNDDAVDDLRDPPNRSANAGRRDRRETTPMRLFPRALPNSTIEDID
jgi:plasmid maintenance system antidote protein VapI